VALAPVALFAYRRPEHARRALASLSRNPEFARSPLHIFCDGARGLDDQAAVDATRMIARAWPHPAKMLHEAPVNRGLAASIAGGVGELCAAHGRVIVVEDDLVVAPVFLDYMNRALERYADSEQVMQISGHMFPVRLPDNGADAVFLPFTTSWGWATWQRAWAHFDPSMTGLDRLAGSALLRRRFDLDNAYPYFSMLRKQRAGKIDSWAIRWYLSVFARDGLVLYPRCSLVSNEGFDGSGTHCGVGSEWADAAVTAVGIAHQRMPSACIDDEAYARVKRLLRSRNGIVQRAARRIGRIFV